MGRFKAMAKARGRAAPVSGAAEGNAREPAAPGGLPARLADRSAPQPDAPAPAARSGVIYVGHLPTGFYEEPLRLYFSQFGRLKNVRVSRNKDQKPRGYAYLEFRDPGVARIAAETMNGYLMWNKILSCHVVERVPPHLFWRGCDRKHYPKPHRAIFREQYNRPRTEEELAQEREEAAYARRQDVERMAALGVDVAALFADCERESAVVTADAVRQQKEREAARLRETEERARAPRKRVRGLRAPPAPSSDVFAQPLGPEDVGRDLD